MSKSSGVVTGFGHIIMRDKCLIYVLIVEKRSQHIYTSVKILAILLTSLLVFYYLRKTGIADRIPLFEDHVAKYMKTYSHPARIHGLLFLFLFLYNFSVGNIALVRYTCSFICEFVNSQRVFLQKLR